MVWCRPPQRRAPNWGSQSARSRLLIDGCADGPGGVYQGACGGGGVMPIPAVACMLTV